MSDSTHIRLNEDTTDTLNYREHSTLLPNKAAKTQPLVERAQINNLSPSCQHTKKGNLSTLYNTE
jgi:hypothetical protein